MGHDRDSKTIRNFELRLYLCGMLGREPAGKQISHKPLGCKCSKGGQRRQAGRGAGGGAGGGGVATPAELYLNWVAAAAKEA